MVYPVNAQFVVILVARDVDDATTVAMGYHGVART